MQAGLKHHQAGRFAKAERIYQQVLKADPSNPDALNLLGVLAHQSGRHEAAVQSIEKAIRRLPSSADFHNNLGEALRALGRIDEALASYDQALKLDARFAEAMSNRGAALHALRRFDEALASYDAALALRPQYADALNNRGATLQELKRFDEALDSYERALVIAPNLAEAHRNQAATLHALGRLTEAEASVRRALQARPDYIEALNNLASLLNAQGQPSKALEVVRQSVQLRESTEAKTLFVNCVKAVRPAHDDAKLRGLLVRALTEPWGRPTELMPIATGLAKLNTEVAACVARAEAAWPARLPAESLFGGNTLATLAANPLLVTLLGSAPIADISVERFLTLSRHTLLESAESTSAPEGPLRAALPFFGALARQCFINEYVYAATDEEQARGAVLRGALAAALEARGKIPLLWPVAVGAYFPLGSLPHAERLLEREWPKAVMDVIAQQVREPAEEATLREAMPHLTGIDDEISQRVRQQYEENPYPRWIKAAPARRAVSIDRYLASRFPLAPISPRGSDTTLVVLIAGCGTGQQAIESALQYEGAQVLAVDLSLASLGYAQRKSKELGLANVEYAQADILKLGAIERRFDIIESVGVLHHLADPWAGWRALMPLLRPGGFMKLGFYSELARRHIPKIREFIASQGFGSTADDIRRIRQALEAARASKDFGPLLETTDFFSTSACRDLLFHVQEHRLTLSPIAEFLRSEGLTFLGFELDAEGPLQAYRQRFPADPAALDLAQWDAFERDRDNADTFLSMYQFWVQKAG